MKIVKVVAAVIRNDNMIFATARGYGEFEGQWEFPGGKVEEGETPQEALKREIQEELEAVIEVEDFITTVEYDYPTFHLSMDCFWCKVVSGELVLKEAEAAKWLTKEDLYSVQWLPADIKVVDLIDEQLESDYYIPVSLIREDYAACRLEIKWNVEKIAGEKNANGYIVQHFRRQEYPSKNIVGDTEYYEAWPVKDGQMTGDYDDAFAVLIPEKNGLVYMEMLVDGFVKAAGNKGGFLFSGDIYWVSINDNLYAEIDSWEPGGAKEAHDLKSVYLYSGLSDRKPLFKRTFSHSWDTRNEEKIISIAKDLFDKAYPNNSVKYRNIEMNINDMNVSDEIKEQLKEYFSGSKEVK